MAVMFPKNINELDPQDSELEVYNQFRKQLDDSYTVFYSVEWNRKRKDGSLEKSEADFIVASPKYGFLCLEVKGGSGIDIDGDKWTPLDNVHGDRPLKRSPYKQAEESMYYFKDKFNTEYHQQYRGLFGAGAIFPFYALPQVESISNRDKACTIEAQDMDNLDKKIRDMFKTWGGSKYGRNQYMKENHEFFLDMIRKRSAMAAAAGALVKFKEKQLDIVNRVQDNYIYFVSNIRQFYMRGGAGTGKTWIAIKMANAEAENGARVLLTCKSKALSAVMKNETSDAVDVIDLESLRENTPAGSYDAIFVDEAQDFSEEDAFNLKTYLKDEKASRLGVFYDDVQKVRAESFGDAFMIDTPPLLLHENIRNTANIYKYATQETDLGTDVITNPVEGPTPKSENIADGKKLTQRLNNLLKEYLVDEGLNTTSLAILVDDADWFMGQLRLRLMYANDLNKKILVVRKSGMKITEIKGLPKGISYTGILELQGDGLNVFFREMENPTHDKWEPNRHSDPDRAKLYKNEVEDWVKDVIRQKVEEMSGAETLIDTGNLFNTADKSTPTDNENEDVPKRENVVDTTKSVEVVVNPTKSTSVRGSGGSGSRKVKGTIDDLGKLSGHRHRDGEKPRKPTGRKGSTDDAGQDNVFAGMTSVNVRARVISVGNGTNRLICTAEKALSYGEVQVLATGENGKSLPIHISNLVKGTNKAEVKNGKIILHDVSPSEKVVVDFQVSGRQNHAMGVEVSGNQE